MEPWRTAIANADPERIENRAAYAKESAPVRFLSTISGAINVGNMIGQTLLQPVIGWALDRRWSGAMAAGVLTYSADAFETAFGMTVAWAVLSCLSIVFTKEPECRQTA